MYLWIVVIICIAAGAFVALKRSGRLNTKSPDEEHNRLYKEAYELIKPYMILHEVPAKDAASERGRRELAQGIARLRDVVRINPENWAAFWIMGKAYQAQGMNSEACDLFAKAYLLQKENADVAREYMFECLKLGRTGQAAELAAEALRLRPDEAGLKANTALCLFLDAQPDKAMEMAEDALRADPSDDITKKVIRAIEEVRTGTRPQPQKYEDL